MWMWRVLLTGVWFVRNKKVNDYFFYSALPASIESRYSLQCWQQHVLCSYYICRHAKKWTTGSKWPPGGSLDTSTLVLVSVKWSPQKVEVSRAKNRPDWINCPAKSTGSFFLQNKLGKTSLRVVFFFFFSILHLKWTSLGIVLKRYLIGYVCGRNMVWWNFAVFFPELVHGEQVTPVPMRHTEKSQMSGKVTWCFARMTREAAVQAWLRS